MSLTVGVIEAITANPSQSRIFDERRLLEQRVDDRVQRFFLLHDVGA